MALPVLVILAVALVVAMAPPRAVRPAFRLGAIIALAVIAATSATGVAFAAESDPSEVGGVGAVAVAGLVTFLIMIVPVASTIRRRYHR